MAELKRKDVIIALTIGIICATIVAIVAFPHDAIRDLIEPLELIDEYDICLNVDGDSVDIILEKDTTIIVLMSSNVKDFVLEINVPDDSRLMSIYRYTNWKHKGCMGWRYFSTAKATGYYRHYDEKEFRISKADAILIANQLEAIQGTHQYQ
ncbi:hypothetical protein KKF61_06385 [Patescibacteria group bacterium]|nr:hypothetical protein [Patescibacteria group bacterium]